MNIFLKVGIAALAGLAIFVGINSSDKEEVVKKSSVEPQRNPNQAPPLQKPQVTTVDESKNQISEDLGKIQRILTGFTALIGSGISIIDNVSMIKKGGQGYGCIMQQPPQQQYVNGGYYPYGPQQQTLPGGFYNPTLII